jgi:hypothetical protein
MATIMNFQTLVHRQQNKAVGTAVNFARATILSFLNFPVHLTHFSSILLRV